MLARSGLVNRVRRGAADCDGPATTDVLPPHISIPACDARKRVSTKPLRSGLLVQAGHLHPHGCQGVPEVPKCADVAVPGFSPNVTKI